MKRERPVNHTYKISLILGNMTPNQVEWLENLLDQMEEEGIKIIEIEGEND